MVVVVHETRFIMKDFLPVLSTGADDSIYRTHGRDVIFIADRLL